MGCDLIGQQDIRKDRAFAKLEGRIARVPHHRPGDVSRHQVGRELDSCHLKIHSRSKGPHQQCLRNAGHTLNQCMSACHERNNQAGDGLILADNRFADLGADPQQGLLG